MLQNSIGTTNISQITLNQEKKVSAITDCLIDSHLTLRLDRDFPRLNKIPLKLKFDFLIEASIKIKKSYPRFTTSMKTLLYTTINGGTEPHLTIKMSKLIQHPS